MHKNYLIVQLFLLFIFIDQSFCQRKGNVTVVTSRGTLYGYHYDQGNDTTQTWYGQGDIFKGIPYGLPPQGNLRYKQPRPLIQFPGSPTPYDATYYRAGCIQPNRTWINYGEESEDCLHLNIWTPNAASTTKYPVLFFIHGGSLVGGTGSMSDEALVRNFLTKGIVVGAMDYRMSWLGFFTTFTDDFPANLGMLDQVLALKFLKEEVGYFGGDSNKITIGGQSADLFQQVIMESGTVLTCYEDAVGPTNRNMRFAEAACNFTQDMWNAGNFAPLKDCLMNINTSAGENIALTIGASNSVCWNMVQDNYFFPGNPQLLAKNRPNIPAIIGNCKDEAAGGAISGVNSNPNYTLGYNRESVERSLLRQYLTWLGNGTKAQQVIKIWEDNYLPPGTADDDHLAWMQFGIDVGSAAYFTWGSTRDIEYYLTNNNPNVFVYEFDFCSILSGGANNLSNWFPVPHVCEMPYVYGYGSGGSWGPTDQAVANLIQGYWANFIKTGKTSTDGSWKPATSKDYTKLEYFAFNNVSSAKVGFRAADHLAWNIGIPQVVGEDPPNLSVNTPLCAKGYQSKVKNNTCYEAFGTPVAWNDAQTNCVQNSYGTLATIRSAFENSDLLAYATKAFPSCTSFSIGLFKGSTPDWVWANYDPSTYRNWKGGSPGQNSCVVLNTNDGTWSTQDCTTTQCYICSY